MSMCSGDRGLLLEAELNKGTLGEYANKVVTLLNIASMCDVKYQRLGDVIKKLGIELDDNVGSRYPYADTASIAVNVPPLKGVDIGITFEPKDYGGVAVHHRLSWYDVSHFLSVATLMGGSPNKPFYATHCLSVLYDIVLELRAYAYVHQDVDLPKYAEFRVGGYAARQDASPTFPCGIGAYLERTPDSTAWCSAVAGLKTVKLTDGTEVETIDTEFWRKLAWDKACYTHKANGATFSTPYSESKPCVQEALSKNADAWALSFLNLK